MAEKEYPWFSRQRRMFCVSSRCPQLDEPIQEVAFFFPLRIKETIISIII